MDAGLMLKQLKIADIKVGSRHRKDMGDLTSLAESIRQEGLLQPIGVTEKLQLIFGERRADHLVGGVLRVMMRSVNEPTQDSEHLR